MRVSQVAGSTRHPKLLLQVGRMALFFLACELVLECRRASRVGWLAIFSEFFSLSSSFESHFSKEGLLLFLLFGRALAAGSFCIEMEGLGRSLGAFPFLNPPLEKDTALKVAEIRRPIEANIFLVWGDVLEMLCALVKVRRGRITCYRSMRAAPHYLFPA